MNSLLEDLRYGLRTLRKSPGFTAVALLTLILGIGANSALFSVVNAVLLRPLPYPGSERIVRAWAEYTQRDMPPLDASEGEILDYGDQVRSFESLGACVAQSVNLTGEGEPERVEAAYATHGFFPTLGTKAILGRAYGTEEDSPGAPPVAVLSHGLWQRHFGSSRDIVGKTIQINGRSAQVLGVMPPGFEFPKDTDLWLPLQIDRANQTPRGEHYLTLLARLRPGVSLKQAQSDIDRIARRFTDLYPVQYPADSGWRVRLVPLLDEVVGDSRQGILVLMGAVLLVLLIACVNVGNLLLARAQDQSRESAIRVALGASRGRMMRQWATETLLLTLAGGGLGLLFAQWGLAAFLAINPDPVPRAAEIHLDARVVVFTLGLTLVTGLVLGLVPALRASRPDLQATFKEGGGKATASAGVHRFRRVLVGLEVALALVLLISAGLTLKSFSRLRGVDPGFKAAGVLTMDLSLPRSRFGEDREASQFYDRLLDRIAALPGVESASSVSLVPFAGGEAHRSATVSAEGQPFTPGDALPEPEVRSIDYRYFQAMGIPLVSGRAFTASDDEKASPMGIVDQVLARRLWPGEQNIVGKRFKMGPPTQDNPNPWVTVMGVARATRQFGLGTDESRGVLYFPQLRRAERAQSLVVRAAGGADPLRLAGPVRGVLRSMSPDLPVAQVMTMEKRIESSLASPRFSMMLLAAFATVAMVLAAVGIYGVVAYSVGQRTHEIGVRMALGAQRRQVLALVVLQGMTVVLAGLALGLLASFWATRALAGLLFGVQATDTATFAGVSLLLALVALAANLLPARRAANLEPTVALRYE